MTSGASHPAPAPSPAPNRPDPRAPFSPDPAQTDALISAIASDFNSSLAGIAEEYNTTLESLTLWMTRPDIAERLDALQSACAARVRLVAANFLPLAVETLRSVLADFRELHCNTLCDTSSPRAIATRARAAENARRAASTLLRLAHFTPRGWRHPTAPLAPAEPAPSRQTSPASPPVPIPADVAPLANAPHSPSPTSSPVAAHPAPHTPAATTRAPHPAGPRSPLVAAPVRTAPEPPSRVAPEPSALNPSAPAPAEPAATPVSCPLTPKPRPPPADTLVPACRPPTRPSSSSGRPA
ncbi:MAG: hypothetical protein IT433_12785 [Phycisphaerales bacterium]|nr:hypothetical protein [Phycisphaerales bacterium]